MYAYMSVQKLTGADSGWSSLYVYPDSADGLSALRFLLPCQFSTDMLSTQNTSQAPSPVSLRVVEETQRQLPSCVALMR